MIGKKKLLIGIIPIFIVGIMLYNKPISRIINVESRIYGAPANTAFTDENFYKCVIDNYNRENDTTLGYDVSLTDEQLGSITNLWCYSRSITNTDGLEKLINLTELDLFNNQLTSIDLSQNINLTRLRLEKNALTNIDLSKNTELTNINLSSNQLTNIDLSKNTELTNINLCENQLTNIDLSNNTRLSELYLNSNQLENIDLSQNTKLQHLEITSNKLTNIDLSENQLTTLYLDENQLTNIDLSKNTELTDLNLRNNQLTSIDLSENTKLERLDLYSNQLTSLDLSKNANLQELSSSLNQLTSIDLSKSTELMRLFLTSNQLTSIDLSKNTKLQLLNLSKNPLTSIDLSNNTELYYLVLSKNNLTSLDLSQNTKLTNLFLNDNRLASLDLSKNTELTELDLRNNQLTSLDLSNNINLEELSIFDQYKNQTLYRNALSYIDDETLVNLILINGIKGKYITNYTYIGKSGSEHEFEFKYYINWINASSDKYIIDEEKNYIYTGTDIDNETILNNINLTEYDGVVGTIENNKYIVKYNDEILKEFDLVNISSDMFDLSKDYLMGAYDTIINNINVNNSSISLNLVTNKIEIKHDDIVLKSFDYVNYTSDKYDLTKDYIKVNDDNIESFLGNINCVGCNAYVYDGANNVTTGNFGENNKLRIIYSDQIIKEFNLKFSVSGVRLNTNKLNLNLDSKKTFQLIADVMPLNAENKNVTWKSSDTSIVSVDENGLVTAKNYGNAVITVKTEDGEFTDTCNVTVSEISTHTVTFKDGNDIYTDEFGENETIVFKTDLEKNGYKLVGWKFYDQVFSLDDKLSMPAVDIELEAVWELVIPEITNYITSDSNITNISFKTDMNNLNLGIDPMYEVKVSKHNGTDKTSGFIGTGDKVKIYLDSQLVSEYEVIIKGDVNGDGNLSVSDISKLYKYLKKKMTMDDCYVDAGNVNGDNRISVSDVSKLYKVLKGKARL